MIYISGTTAAGQSASVKKKNSKAGVSGFSDLLSASDVEEAETSGVSTASAANQLLFLQEINDDDYQKKESIEQGFDALQYLDNIRVGLLSSTLSKETIINLASLLEKFKKKFNDPKLSQILEEIELRAKVEIAKYERN